MGAAPIEITRKSKDFFDLPNEQRQLLIDLHTKQKWIRHEKELIDIERRKAATRELNNQTDCDHPFAVETYKADENEFGNLTGGGTYHYHCEDCGLRWREKK